MPEYECNWRINVIADTPEEAAEQAELLMSKRLQSCWSVRDLNNPEALEQDVEVTE